MRLRLPELSAATYRRITFVAVVLLGAIIVTGGAVRLTDSGLGCPDWPTCKGGLARIDATDSHAAIESVNRLITGLVSVAVIVCVLGSLRRIPRRRDLVWLSIGLVGGVFAQAVLGGLVVIFDLQPPLVMAHFLLSIALLTNAVVLYRRAGQPEGPAHPVVGRELQLASRALLAVAALVLVAGTFVTATGPHLGDPEVEPLRFDPPEVARVHGGLVITLLLVIGTTLVLLWRRRGPRPVTTRLLALLALVLAQGTIGYVQYFNGIPELLVGFHIAGAAAVWSAALWYHLGLFTREPASALEPSPRATLAGAARA